MQTQVIQRRHSKAERIYLRSLPYDEVQPLYCGHSPLYVLKLEENQPPFCGLCLIREGYEAELPTRLHLFKTLAENGNPETSPKFFAHLFLVQGLVSPRVDADGNLEPLHEFRRRRGQLRCSRDCPQPCFKHAPRTREQYTEPAWRLFPVGSALWKLMGYQPPLGIVLVRGVNGRTESEIAKELETSRQNIHIRMAKAVRTVMGYLPRGKGPSEPDRSYAGDRILAGA